jgi:hypothetical protein
MKRPWFAELEPAAPHGIPDDALLPDRAQLLAESLGPGPAGWAVELGASMAARITAAIPELAVDAVADEVAKGCEAVALGALSALALDDHVPFTAMPEVLGGPMEVVARGIGIEHMLRSIHVAHAAAADQLLDAAERLVPESERFLEMRRINQARSSVRGADRRCRRIGLGVSASALRRASDLCVTFWPPQRCGRVRRLLRRCVLDECDIEAVGPEDAEDAVVVSYASVTVHGVALLKPRASGREHFIFVLVFEVVPEAAGNDDSVVITTMNVRWSCDAGGVFHEKCCGDLGFKIAVHQ